MEDCVSCDDGAGMASRRRTETRDEGGDRRAFRQDKSTLSFADSDISSLSSLSSPGMNTSGSGSSATPPTSVTSDGSKVVGERAEGGKKRRAWRSSNGAGEGDGRKGDGGGGLAW